MVARWCRRRLWSSCEGADDFFFMEDLDDFWASLSLGSDDNDNSSNNKRDLSFSFDFFCDDLGFGEKICFADCDDVVQATSKRLKTHETHDELEGNEDGDDLTWVELDETEAAILGFANEFPVFWSRRRNAHVALTTHVLQYATPIWLRKLCPEATERDLAEFVKRDKPDRYSLRKARDSGVFVADVGPGWGKANDRHPVYRTNQSTNKAGRKPRAMLLTDALAWARSEERKDTYKNRANKLKKNKK